MKRPLIPLLCVAAIVALACAPWAVDDYGLGLLVGVTGACVLASAWAMFSGPTRYVSLATVAFFGIGAYAVAVLGEVLPYWAVLVVAAAVGLLVAAVVGLSTLRLAGVYFVIFTFGLAELVRQLLTWYEVNVTGTLGRYIFVPVDTRQIYWMLLALVVATLFIRWAIERSRLGLALRAIGDDEVVAEHCGVNVTLAKVCLFALSAVIMTLAGAIQAPRWVYVEPSIVFNPSISFMALIMALLGGANRLWGPVVGAVPLFFLFEWISANFPNHYPVILGLLFILIVFALPHGVMDLVEGVFRRLRAHTGLSRGTNRNRGGVSDVYNP